MSFWSAAVAIVAILAYAATRIARYRAGLGDPHRGRHRHDETLPPPSPDPELLREVEALRKRVVVLERITTDERKSRSIAAEIESLRDS